jgi:hypothetical protein
VDDEEETVKIEFSQDEVTIRLTRKEAAIFAWVPIDDCTPDQQDILYAMFEALRDHGFADPNGVGWYREDDGT